MSQKRKPVSPSKMASLLETKPQPGSPSGARVSTLPTHVAQGQLGGVPDGIISGSTAHPSQLSEVDPGHGLWREKETPIESLQNDTLASSLWGGGVGELELQDEPAENQVGETVWWAPSAPSLKAPAPVSSPSEITKMCHLCDS